MSRKARHNALEAAAFKEMVREHWLIPVLGLTAILVIGATRFDESRQLLALLIALGTPVAAMVVALAPLREAHPTLRAVTFSVAAFVGFGAELLLAPSMVTSELPALLTELVRWATSPVFPVGLLAAALATVPLEAIAVRRGVGSRFSALAGVTVGLALYLPAHLDPKDPLGGVLVGFLVAVFIGGGVGLGLGTLARAATGSRV